MPFFVANISDGYLFNNKSLRDRVAACIDAGFEAVELNNPYQYPVSIISSMLGDSDSAETVELACMNSHCPVFPSPEQTEAAATNPTPSHLHPAGYMGWASVPGAFRSFDASLSTTVAYADTLNCKTVNLLAGMPMYSYQAIMQSVVVEGVRTDADGGVVGVDVSFVLPDYDAIIPQQQQVLSPSSASTDSVAPKRITVTLPLSCVTKDGVKPKASLSDATAAAYDIRTLLLMKKLLPEHMLTSSAVGSLFSSVFLPSLAQEVEDIYTAIDAAKVDGPVVADDEGDVECGVDVEALTLQASVASDVDVDDDDTHNHSPNPNTNNSNSNTNAATTVMPMVHAVCPVSLFPSSSYPHILTHKKLPPSVASLLPDILYESIVFTTTVVNLKRASAVVQRSSADTYVTLEAVSDASGYYFDNIHKLLRLVVHANADNLGLLFDCYHMYRLHGSVCEMASSLLPLIRHIQVASVPRRREPDRGELNYMYLFKHIDKAKYQGWTGLEYIPQQNKTKQGLYPWFEASHRKRHGSGGIMFTCVGKQGRPYLLLGQDHKRGNPWGPFWGRPDKDDKDQESTAVRETIEESLGVVANATVLYSALKNQGYHAKFPNLNLYVVHLGVLSMKEREEIIAHYAHERELAMALTKCQKEMLGIRWFEANDIYKAIIKKKGDCPSLRGFFKKELTKAMDEEWFKTFCEKKGLSLFPLTELIKLAEDEGSAKKWNSAPV